MRATPQLNNPVPVLQNNHQVHKLGCVCYIVQMVLFMHILISKWCTAAMSAAVVEGSS
jgi:hypothetical protein